MGEESAPVCYLTTTGRTSGRRHRIEIWYLLSRDNLYLLSGNGERADWVRNIAAHPEVTVEMPRSAQSGASAEVRTYFADLDPVDDDLAIREGFDARYHGWAPGRPLSQWASESMIVRLRAADDT